VVRRAPDPAGSELAGVVVVVVLLGLLFTESGKMVLGCGVILELGDDG